MCSRNRVAGVTKMDGVVTSTVSHLRSAEVESSADEESETREDEHISEGVV